MAKTEKADGNKSTAQEQDNTPAKRKLQDDYRWNYWLNKDGGDKAWRNLR